MYIVLRCRPLRERLIFFLFALHVYTFSETAFQYSCSGHVTRDRSVASAVFSRIFRSRNEFSRRWYPEPRRWNLLLYERVFNAPDSDAFAMKFERILRPVGKIVLRTARKLIFHEQTSNVFRQWLSRSFDCTFVNVCVCANFPRQFHSRSFTTWQSSEMMLLFSYTYTFIYVCT